MTPTHPILALSNKLTGSIVRFAVDWPSVDFSFEWMMPSCVPFWHFSCGKSLAMSKDIATKHPATAIMDASLKASRSILRPSFHIGLFHLNFKTITTKSRLRIRGRDKLIALLKNCKLLELRYCNSVFANS